MTLLMIVMVRGRFMIGNQIRQMGHARTISAPPQRTTRARSLEA